MHAIHHTSLTQLIICNDYHQVSTIYYSKDGINWIMHRDISIKECKC